MYIALTGTPGTGKTTAARILAERGHRTITVEELAGKCGALDESAEGPEVDVEILSTSQQPDEEIIVVGHLAHFVPARMCIVLRAHPDIIRERLVARGYAPEKVRANAEAEAIDLILCEALDNCLFVWEIDATAMTPEEIADAIERIMKGEIDDYAPGRVDWSRAVMDWY